MMLDVLLQLGVEFDGREDCNDKRHIVDDGKLLSGQRSAVVQSALSIICDAGLPRYEQSEYCCCQDSICWRPG
jgi:hypothetical protein